jgi:hypothetical protein
MPQVGIAALLALFPALASAFGNVIRQRSAQEVTEKPVGHLKLFRMPLRDTSVVLGSAGPSPITACWSRRWAWVGGVGDDGAAVRLADLHAPDPSPVDDG